MTALVLLCLLATAPDKTKVVVTEDATNRAVSVGDATNKAVRVNCVTGCTAGGASGGKVLDGTAAGEADVVGSAPAGTEQGLVTRNIPSGTQPVSGSVSVSNLPATQPVSGPLTDAQLRATAVPVSGTFWQATQPVSGTFFQATQPVSGTVTANAGSGTFAVSGPLTDTQLRATAVPVSGTFWQATQPVSGTVTANAGTGTMAVSAASLPLPSGASTAAKQPALGTAGTASADVLSVQGVASMTALKVDGSAVTQPVSGTFFQVTQPVSVASGTLSATQSGTWTVQQGGTWTVRAVGNNGGVFDAANNAAMPANVIATGLETATIDTSPTAATAGLIRRQLASTEGVTYVQEGGPKRFSCFVTAVTATTQCQAAPASGLRAYVTSLSMSNQAATVQTLDVVSGTGTNCATNTAALTHKVQFGTNATTTSPQSYEMPFPTPLVPVAANAICVRPSAATAFGATLTGYIAP